MSDATSPFPGKDENFGAADLLVASKARPVPMLAIAVLFGGLALVLFLVLNARRLDKEKSG